MKGRRIRIGRGARSGNHGRPARSRCAPEPFGDVRPGIPSATHYRLALRLAVFGVALLISVLLLAASRMTWNRRPAAE